MFVTTSDDMDSAQDSKRKLLPLYNTYQQSLMFKSKDLKNNSESVDKKYSTNLITGDASHRKIMSNMPHHVDIEL